MATTSKDLAAGAYDACGQSRRDFPPLNNPTGPMPWKGRCSVQKACAKKLKAA